MPLDSGFKHLHEDVMSVCLTLSNYDYCRLRGVTYNHLWGPSCFSHCSNTALYMNMYVQCKLV